MDKDQTLAAILEYAQTGGGRITTAAQYLADLVKCVRAGGACPVKAVDLSDADRAIKEAAAKLVYSDQTQTLIGEVKAKSTTSTGTTESFIATFDGRMSTIDKDRDGDILEPSGMILVEKMPLLWQHNHSQPVGAMIKNISQTKKLVDNEYGLVDIPLARDATKLLSVGALRLSHGFDPHEAEPIDTYVNSKGQEIPTGWHITKMEVYETSLVSVPANAKASILRYHEKQFDSLCRAKSLGGFETDVVKNYLDQIDARRPRIFKGWIPEKSAATVEATVAKTEQGVETETIEKPRPVVSSIAKAFSNGSIKSVHTALDSPWMEGSYERMLYNLQLALQKAKGERYEKYVDIVSTFEDAVVFCVTSYSPVKQECYRVNYSIDGDSVTLGADFQEVEVKATVVEKSFQKALANREVKPPVDGESETTNPPVSVPTVKSPKNRILKTFGL